MAQCYQVDDFTVEEMGKHASTVLKSAVDKNLLFSNDTYGVHSVKYIAYKHCFGMLTAFS